MNLIVILEKHLTTILFGAVTMLLAYATGTAQTTATIRELSGRVQALEDRVKASGVYHNCATRHFDMLERGEKGSPPCDLEGM